jgi:hypothetical protein
LYLPLKEAMMTKMTFNYVLDESDPDIVILRRRDGYFVAAFSASGATEEGIREAAMEDYRNLVRSSPNLPGSAI